MKHVNFSSQVYTSPADQPIIDLQAGVGKTLNLSGNVTINGLPVGTGSVLTNVIVALDPGADCTVFDNCTEDIYIGSLANEVYLNTLSVVNDFNLNGTDITILAPLENDILKYDGTKFINTPHVSPIPEFPLGRNLQDPVYRLSSPPPG